MRLYRRNKKWWFDLRHRGVRYHRTTGTDNLKRANAIMRGFIAELELGTHRPAADKVTFEQLCDLARAYYRIQEHRSGKSLEASMKRLARAFAGIRAIDITTSRIEKYKAQRLSEGTKKSTINNELAALSLGFRLAVEQGLLATKPTIHRLDTSDNVRQGFVSQGDYYAIREHLPERLADLTDFLWWTGLRLGTARKLEWRDVHAAETPSVPSGSRRVMDRDHGPAGFVPDSNRLQPRGGDSASTEPMGSLSTLRIRSETVKTKIPHEIPLVGEIAAVIERAASYRMLLCPYVFQLNGRQLSETWCWAHWKNAAQDAGLAPPNRCVGYTTKRRRVSRRGGIGIHDLRRSFVRNMRLAGLPETTIMSFTGHTTRSVFGRYNIIDQDEKRVALERLEAHLSGQSKEPSVRRIK